MSRLVKVLLILLAASAAVRWGVYLSLAARAGEVGWVIVCVVIIVGWGSYLYALVTDRSDADRWTSLIVVSAGTVVWFIGSGDELWSAFWGASLASSIWWVLEDHAAADRTAMFHDLERSRLFWRRTSERANAALMASLRREQALSAEARRLHEANRVYEEWFRTTARGGRVE